MKMKVLRPKVYITETSNFKTLVQHLTGYDDVSAPSKYSLVPQLQIVDDEKVVVPVIDIVDEDDHHGGSSSMEYSSFDIDASNIIEEIINYDQATCYEPLQYHDTKYYSSEYIFMNQILQEEEDYAMVYGDLQSWPLDNHEYYPNSFNNFDYCQTHQQLADQVRIYDY